MSDKSLRIKITGTLTLRSQEIYDEVCDLAEEDKLFNLISDLLCRNSESNEILSKLNTILEVVEGGATVGLAPRTGLALPAPTRLPQPTPTQAGLTQQGLAQPTSTGTDLTPPSLVPHTQVETETAPDLATPAPAQAEVKRVAMPTGTGAKAMLLGKMNKVNGKK
ncbi:hypothetical protein AGMMS49975_10060 [Clostridia bacterium]|nr:hypothetical protein AGMMS49975_10060 [Clostridia bacterium]